MNATANFQRAFLGGLGVAFFGIRLRKFLAGLYALAMSVSGGSCI